ncbi:MAG: alpha/beta hydrolase [Christensenellaceae bacterium]|nr:alpha/beta hydrolase [Christensenellaceae bacterium]
MEHKYIESKNGITHYWVKHNKNASAKCIVFTHGLTANHSMFEKQIEYFYSDYHIIAWDVPLHGLSRPYFNFSYKQASIELHSILEVENITKTILVGMSMGGYPSQMFADMFPEMVEGFVAIDTTPFGLKYYSKSDMWWLKQVEPIVKLFPDSLLRTSMARSVSKTQYSYNKMMEMLKPLTKAQIIEQMGIGYGKFVLENKDVVFNFPVLILLGDSDKTGKVKKYCKDWSKSTGYPLHIIKNAAHFSNGDNPEQVNAEIESFIKGL